MPYYLDFYVGDGTHDDPFRPSSFDDDPDAVAIDLRPDGSRADGLAVVRSAISLPTKNGREKIGDGKTGKSRALVNHFQSKLGINMSSSTNAVDESVAELLLRHARTDGTRWRPLRPAGSRHEIWLGDLLWSRSLVEGDEEIGRQAGPRGLVSTESFNKADSTVLGPDQTWAEVLGDLEVLTNQGHLVTINNYAVARCAFNTGGADMYAQIVVVDLSVNCEAYVMARFASAATTAYSAQHYYYGTQDLHVQKVVAGSWSSLTSGITQAFAANEVLRLECAGSSIRMLVNGVVKSTITDTSITTGTQGGFGGYRSGGDTHFDSFQTGDLNQTIVPPAIASGEALGAPTITVGGVAILPVAIASAQAFGAPTILNPAPGLNISPVGIASTGAIGVPTMTVGSVVTTAYSPDFDRFDNMQIFVVDKFGTVYGELPGIVVDSVEWKLNESGAATVNFNNRDPSIAKLFLMKRELQIVWNNVINAETGLPEVWWGILGGESGKPGIKSFTLEGVQSWLKVRPIETASIDFNVATDQFDIAWALINAAQTGTNYALNFTASYTPSGHTRLRRYDRERHQYFYDLLMEFSSLKLKDGFDWEFVLDRAAGHRVWTPYFPSKGVYRPECRLEWGRNIVNYDFKRDGFGMASKVYGTGASANGVKFEQSYEDAAVSAEYGVIVKVVSDAGQADLVWLLGFAQQTQTVRSSPPTNFSVTVKDIAPGPENDYHGVPIFGRLHVGDTVDVSIDDYGNQVVGRFRVLSFKWNKNGEHEINFVNPANLVTV